MKSNWDSIRPEGPRRCSVPDDLRRARRRGRQSDRDAAGNQIVMPGAPAPHPLVGIDPGQALDLLIRSHNRATGTSSASARA